MKKIIIVLASSLVLTGCILNGLRASPTTPNTQAGLTKVDDVVPMNAITFIGTDNKIVGTVTWEKGKLKFKGNIDNSAKSFFEYWWKQYAYPNSCRCEDAPTNTLKLK